MLHPSYVDLMNVVNSTSSDEEPVVESRYSIVIATAKRARQLIGGKDPLVKMSRGKKPLSMAVEELYDGQVRILSENERLQEEEIIGLSSEEEFDEISIEEEFAQTENPSEEE